MFKTVYYFTLSSLEKLQFQPFLVNILMKRHWIISNFNDSCIYPDKQIHRHFNWVGRQSPESNIFSMQLFITG